MLRAIVDRRADERDQAAGATAIAQEALAAAFHKLSLELHTQAMAKANDLRNSQLALEDAIEVLHGRAQHQATAAQELEAQVDLLLDEVEELGDPEDWLQLMEAHLRSISCELKHIDQQIAHARLKQAPA
jgi:chromosome segregation ATPase